ncbi:uncharacterized protein [Apostichopus japonicus]|uniref:uncharacterized protein n=1 Tax=Stichopus japonicus TaxID=307972 RepID=UPI003AB53BFB
MTKTKMLQSLLLLIFLDVVQAGKLCDFAKKFPCKGKHCLSYEEEDDTTMKSTSSSPTEALSSSPGNTVSSSDTTGQGTSSSPNEALSSSPGNTVSSSDTIGQGTSSSPNEALSSSPDNTVSSSDTTVQGTSSSPNEALSSSTGNTVSSSDTTGQGTSSSPTEALSSSPGNTVSSSDTTGQQSTSSSPNEALSSLPGSTVSSDDTIGQQSTSSTPNEARSSFPGSTVSSDDTIGQQSTSSTPNEALSSLPGSTVSSDDTIGQQSTSSTPNEALFSLPGSTVSSDDTIGQQSTSSTPNEALSSLPGSTVSSDDTIGQQSTSSTPNEALSSLLDTTVSSDDTSPSPSDTTVSPSPTVCQLDEMRCYNEDHQMVCSAPENCTCQLTSINASISAGGFYVNSNCTKRAHCINGNVTWDGEYNCSPNAQCEEQRNVRQCYCKAGYHGDGQTCESPDCKGVYDSGHITSGIYTTKPTNWPGPPFTVYCNMTDGGGWTVFQRRVNGSVDFYRNWLSYKEGFGELDHEFWLGNDKLYYLTNQGNYQLRIDLVDREGNQYYAEYDLFRINDENDNYRLSGLGTFNGTDVGDGLRWHYNHRFTTYDRDNDILQNNCAKANHGAWWYRGCCHSNLNGNYHANLVPATVVCCGQESTVCWKSLPGPDHNIQYTEMKIREIL